ncbi:MAG: YesL family protein, partial [Eubacteriales bacterium]
GFSALYYVMFRTLRGDGVVNPFKEFWAGLKANFKQATISWIIFVLLIAFLLTDIRICKAAGGALDLVKIAVYALGAAAVIIYLYLIPVMTAFRDTLPHLIRNAVYFLIKKPWKTVVILFFDIFPFVLTYSDLQSLPLYAFLWVLCGFGLQAMLGATLLLPEFAPYLASKEEEAKEEAAEPESHMRTEEEILEDMRRLDGL